MKVHTCLRLAPVAILLLLAAAVSMAMQFDPAFRILRIKGDVVIAPPDSTNFVPVKTGKAYRFGSTVRTVTPDSEATIALSDNHQCKLSAGTTARFADEGGDRENRTVHLASGKVEVELDRSEQKFIKYTNRVYVQTSVAIVSGERAKFAATVSRQKDVTEALFECSAGMIGVSGMQFQAPAVREGSIVKVSGPNDLAWLRVQTVKGDVSYDVRNDSSEPIAYPSKSGSLLKINQQIAESGKIRHVVLWMLKPDGTTDTNYTYKVALDAPPQPQAGEAAAGAEPKQP